MSAFISKFLPGRNVPKTKLELITEAWNNIQKYYETAADPLKDAVDLTPIPQSLDNIFNLIQAEEIECERETGSLETGPCLEYLLQKRVLEELVEFAKVDTPYGMRIHCLRFFCKLVTNVHAQLLPERAVHVPLQKLINSSHRLISRHYEELALAADNNNSSTYETCSEERIAAISELTLELAKLMHGIFSHFKGANAALMDLFFERGWCRSRGESVWRCSKDGKLFHKRKESVEEKIAWDMFLMPRFDMFQYLIDLMNMPGETGEIARESILFALRLLEHDPEYVCYIVEYSNLCEVMAERLAFYFAHLPKNKGAFSITSNNRINSVRPSRRHIRFSIPATITNNSLLITVNAQSSFKKKRRKRTPFDIDFLRTLETTIDKERIIDDFFSFWEYLNDVARVAEKRLMTALMAQLTTTFWHPVICTALSSPSAEVSTAATAYTTEMIRSLTDQRLLHVFLIVLLGEDSGIGKDLEPEVKMHIPIRDLIDDDKRDEDDDENNSTTHTTRSSEDDGGKQHTTDDAEKLLLEKKRREEADEELTLRLLLINRIDAENYDLALATLRLFDTIIETYNQFAVYNLVLRNYLDITPEGNYIEEDANRDNLDTSSFETRTIDDQASFNTAIINGTAAEETSKVDELAVADKSDSISNSNKKADDKKEKVRWLVERVISLLPLEDELERMKTPPLSSIISRDSFVANVDNYDDRSEEYNSNSMNPYSMVPGNSYDDYFHEAQERFHYALLARNFWQSPFPPVKTEGDLEREAENRKGRPVRPTETEGGPDFADHGDPKSSDQASITSSATNNTTSRKRFETYEGLFLSRLFDQFQKMLELPMEQNLLITSILQKIVGVVDKRMDGMLCDWRAVRVGNDGALYGGVWTLPSAKSNRRTLYAILETVTFEALKRAQLVPNFETRISLAKKRGISSNINHNVGSPRSSLAQHNERRSLSSKKDDYYHQPQQQQSSGNLSQTSSRKSEQSKPTRSHSNLSRIIFNKGANTDSSPLASPRTSTSTKPAKLLPLKITRDMGIGGSGVSTPGSPSSTFFQNSQRPNTTPVTITNPFAKFSNFVNAYIVLQEFCKELAAVILVRHATNYNDVSFVRYQGQREMMILDPVIQNNQATWAMNGNDEVFIDEEGGGDTDDFVKRKNFEKWRNRISVISTMTTADWRSVKSLDTIDEAIAARIPFSRKPEAHNG